MSKLSWKETNDIMSSMGEAPEIDRDAFWKKFKEEAEFLPREPAVVKQEPQHVPAFGLRMVAALGCVVFIAAIVTFLSLNNPSAPAVADQDNNIEAFEVLATNTGVTIIREDVSNSTILWIEGME